MKISIIQDDGVVGVDGEFRAVDLTALDANIHAVQFDTASGVGHIEYDADIKPRLPNKPLGKTAFRPFERFITIWKAAGNPPTRPPEEIKLDARAQIDGERERKLAEGLNFNGVLWHTDTVFQAQITAYATAYATGLLAPAATVIIRGKDNSNNTLSRAQLLQLAGALMTFVSQAYAASWAKKDALG